VATGSNCDGSKWDGAGGCSALRPFLPNIVRGTGLGHSAPLGGGLTNNARWRSSARQIAGPRPSPSVAAAEHEPSWLVQFDRLTVWLPEKKHIRGYRKRIIPQACQGYYALIFLIARLGGDWHSLPITRRPPEARAGRLDSPAIPNMARLRRLRDSRQTKPLSKAGAMQPCSYRTGIGAAWARTLSGRRYASVAAPCEPDAHAGQTRAPPFTGGVPAARLSSGRC
jgi:hypothetical protein